MKKNNVVKNIINIVVVLIVVLAIVLLIKTINTSKENENVQIEKISEQPQILENVEETRIKTEVTSRHSITKSRQNINLQEIIEKEEVKEEEIVIENQYTKIEDIVISRNMDLTVRTGISKEDFKVLISNVKQDSSKFFYDNSDFIYDLCQEYQINEIFFCGLISAESGWNIASNHRRTHNYISLMNKNGLIKYNSVEEGLIAAAKALHNNYLTEGGRFYHGKTLYGVKTKFCPASSTWVELVYGRMQQIMNSR